MIQYMSPSDDGYSEFGDLLRLGAIQEVPMYIDTVGGGGAPGTPDDIYFRPNKDLKFVDRLPGTEMLGLPIWHAARILHFHQVMKFITRLMMLSLVAWRLVMTASMEQWMISTLRPEIQQLLKRRTFGC